MVFWTSAQPRSSLAVMAFMPMTCSVSAHVVMGAGASRNTSWISRKHSPGRNKTLRGRYCQKPASPGTKSGLNSRMAASRCTMLDDLLLQTAHNPAQLGSLPAQSVHDVQLGHRNSPSWIKGQDGSRTTPPLGKAVVADAT